MSIQALERALDILEALSRVPEGLTLSAIGAGVGLPKSTAFRILATLEGRGYVERREGTGAYRLGPLTLALCSRRLNDLDLKVEAQPVLSRLCRHTWLTVFLAILQDGHAVYVDSFETESSLRKYAIIGQRRPLYCSGLGKALLMGMDGDGLRRAAAGTAFIRHTATTITGAAALVAEIEAARRRGWVVDDRELEPTIRCVAAPIRDYTGRGIAAASVSWDLSAQPDRDPERLGPLVAAAALAVSRRLGHADEDYSTTSSS